MTCRWPLTTRVTGFVVAGLGTAGEGDIAIVVDDAASVPTPAPRVHPPTTNAMTSGASTAYERGLSSVLSLPESGTIDAQRKRLIAELPDDDKVVLFDRPRKVVESMADNVDKATPEQKADLVRLLVRRVEARDRVNVMDSIMWSPHVRAFFEHVDDVAECPRTD